MTLSSSDYIYCLDKFADFKPNQTVIIKKKFLPHIKSLKYEDSKFDLPTNNEWYPLVNSYYPYTEDVDAFARVNHLLENTRSLSSLQSKTCPSETNFYSQKQPQYQFLHKKPISFLILGKPGIGEDILAKHIAHYRKCVYIDPKLLLEEEIESGRRTGECIEFNLRSGRAIGIDVVIRLLPKKLESPEVEHRGFVLCGFPLIPNDLYEDDPISSESAVFNVKEIFEELFDIVVGENESGKVEVSMVSPTASLGPEKVSHEDFYEPDINFDCDSIKSDGGVCGSKDVASDLEKQIKILFGLYEIPFFVIYMYSSNTDVIAKRENYRYDVTTQTILDMQKINLFEEVGTTNEFLTRDVFNEGYNPFLVNSSTVVRLPKDFRASVSTQLDHYHNTVANLIDSRVMFHDNQYYIKLDARTYISNMIDKIIERLALHAIQKIVIPQRFSVSFAIQTDEDAPAEPEELTIQEAFSKYSRLQTVGPRFNWTWSDWGELCPVSMSRGEYKKGNPRFAVHFLNRIFFLADEEAWYSFYSNPRPYLLPPFPKIGARILIYGPPCSGKSAIAESLKYVFNYTIMSYEDMQHKYIRNKMKEFRETVRQSAITEALALLNKQREEELARQTEERKQSILEWENASIIALSQHASIIGKQESEPVPELELKPEPEILEKQKLDEGTFTTLIEMKSVATEEEVELNEVTNEDLLLNQVTNEELSLNQVTNEESSLNQVTNEELLFSIKALEELNLPIIYDRDYLDQIVEDKTLLHSFLPERLKTEIDLDPVTVLHPFVLDFATQKVQEIDEEKLAQYYKDNISETYLQVLHKVESVGGFSGWILDGMIPNVNLLKDIMNHFTVDEIFILEDQEGYEFLRANFKTKSHVHRFYDFKQVFRQMGEYEAAMKCPQESTTDFKQEMVREILSDIIDECANEDVEANIERHELSYLEKLQTYSEGIREVLEFFRQTEKDVIVLSVTGLTTNNLIKTAINKLRDRYRQVATEYTEADRANDLQIYLAENLTGGEGEGPELNPDNFNNSRQFGDFLYYCPVSFAKQWVIWRGKEQYAVKFKNKLYLMATEKNFRNFMESPRKYLPLEKPPHFIPPPRICVVGVRGSGKTTISKLLAKNLGVYYLSYSDMVSTFASRFSGTALNVEDIDIDPLSNFEQKFCGLWFDEPIRSTGFVLDDFPKTLNDLEMMIKNVTVPDLIVNISVTHETHIVKMLENCLNNWRMEIEEERGLQQSAYDEIMAEWEFHRKQRYHELIEIKRQQRYSGKITENEVNEPEVEDNALAAKRDSAKVVVEGESIEPVSEKVVEGEGIEPVSEKVVEGEGIEPVSEKVVEGESIEPVSEKVIEGQGIEPDPEKVVEEQSIEPEPGKIVEEQSIEPETKKVVAGENNSPSTSPSGSKRVSLKIENENNTAEVLEEDSGKAAESETIEPDASMLVSDQVSINSIEEEKDIEEVLAILNEEMPEPIFDFEHEPEDLAIQRFSTEVEQVFFEQSQLMETLRKKCEEELISWTDVDGSLPLEKTVVQTYLATNAIKFRNKSFFEQCQLVSSETAEKLLDVGYYFMSNFGRICPVQYYYKDNLMYLYTVNKNRSELYPVIHRQYIYFLGGRKNYEQFLKDPLKFTNQKVNFPVIPFKVAVIGPPKCGKSTVVARFKQQLGFDFISRGKAVRFILKNFPFIHIAVEMENLLRKGEELTSELVMESVRIAVHCSDPMLSCAVFDGFPNSIEEMNLLSRMGLVPHLIFDLKISEENMYHFLESMEGEHIFSKKFIAHRYQEWQNLSQEFRSYCDREYQNVYKVQVDKSCWGVYEEIKEVILSVTFEIKHYYQHCQSDWPLIIANMLVTPLEFLERQSGYKSYCPVCLHHSRKLINGGDPPDRTGLVQFREHFYWICHEHLYEFLKMPDAFITPHNISLPSDLPLRVTLTEMTEDVMENGACIVCYSTQLPKIKPGSIEYAVEFIGKIYLFDSESCLTKFMETPMNYFGITTVLAQDLEYPPLDLSSLRTLGHLEQYVARQLVKSITHVNIIRPVVPGLSISASALLCIGLQFKLFNPNTPPEHVELYRNGLELFHKRRNNLLVNLEQMKKVLNPYVKYEETDEGAVEEASEIDFVRPERGSGDSSFNTRRVPVPDDRFDYLCEYFKPLSKVPAFLNVVDIAGLVKGASEGQGLGNAFLSHISACDAIFHLCRAFEDDDVTHVEGEINPVRDLEIIAEELRLKDEDTLSKNLDKLEKTVVRGSDKKLKQDYDTLVKIKSVLVDEKQHIRFGDWDAKDIEVLNKYLFLTSKPTLYLVNLSEKDYIKKKNKWLIKIKEWVDKNDPGALIIPFSGAFENKLVEEYGEDEAARKKFLEEVNATSALDKIIVQGYKALQLEYFFTAGADEVKAWTIQKATKAPQAAGRIHTDFEKGFIMAEVMKFVDFKEEGSETACKAAGKYRQQGRNYTVEDGDIIFFKFNAGAGLKDAKKK